MKRQYRSALMASILHAAGVMDNGPPVEAEGNPLVASAGRSEPSGPRPLPQYDNGPSEPVGTRGEKRRLRTSSSGVRSGDIDHRRDHRIDGHMAFTALPPASGSSCREQMMPRIS